MIKKSPVLAGILLESGNLQQIYHMWHTHSAAGQSIWGWISVNAALWIYWNLYRFSGPSMVWAKWTTFVGTMINTAVIISVLRFM